MASVLPVLLFCLLLQHTPAYSENLCMFPNGRTGNLFNLTVDSTDYLPNKTYHVTIFGTHVQVEVALSAVVNGSSFGTWTGNSANCSGILETRNVTKTNMWTSPADMSVNVTISAYVKTSDGTFLLTALLSSKQMTSMASTAISEPSTSSTGSMTSTAISEPSTSSTGSMTSTATSKPNTASTGSMTSTAASKPNTGSTGSMTSTATSEPNTASTGSMTSTAASSMSSAKTNSAATTVTKSGPTSKKTTMNKSTNPTTTTTTGNAMSAFKTSSGFVITLIFFALIALQQSQ
ncbi:uncharacterized protein LOC144480032 [Mustelus asterias]